MKGSSLIWPGCCFVVVSDFWCPRPVARQAPQPMGFPRQECWSGLPFPSPGDVPVPGIKPVSPALAGDVLLLSHWGAFIQPGPFQNASRDEGHAGLLASGNRLSSVLGMALKSKTWFENLSL